jgi:hypothetical protein
LFGIEVFFARHTLDGPALAWSIFGYAVSPDMQWLDITVRPLEILQEEL